MTNFKIQSNIAFSIKGQESIDYLVKMREEDILFETTMYGVLVHVILFLGKICVANYRNRQDGYVLAVVVFLLAFLGYVWFIADTMKNCHNAANRSNWCLWWFVSCSDKNECKSTAENKTKSLFVIRIISGVFDFAINYWMYAVWQVPNRANRNQY